MNNFGKTFYKFPMWDMTVNYMHALCVLAWICKIWCSYDNSHSTNVLRRQ